MSNPTLEELKARFSSPGKQAGGQASQAKTNGLDVGRYLGHYGIGFREKQQDGATLYCLDECLFDSSHAGNEASIIKGADGLLRYQCFHDSCKGHRWADAKQKISGNDSLAQFSTNGHRPRTGTGGKTKQEKGAAKEPSQVDILLALAGAATLYHTPDGKAYGSFEASGHRELWPVRSRQFRSWLSYRFYREREKGPSSQAMQDALNTIEARARFDGEKTEVHMRVAELDGRVYLDLCDDAWRVVEITEDGWRLLDSSPVHFRRTPTMLSLPEPVPGGHLSDLRGLLNAEDDNGWVLTQGWLVSPFSPNSPLPILALEGEHGSGKSFYSEIVRSTVDPSSAALRSPPKDAHDLAVAAGSSCCVAFNNLSGVPPWLSDGLCCLSTGGAFGTRTLYTDDEETVFSGKRPVILNGIDRIAARNDLADRCITRTLPAIPEHQRRTEKELREEYERLAPGILGALLEAVACGLKCRDSVRLARLPRMADFAVWAVACEPALDCAPGAFLAAYEGNRGEAVEQALEADTVATALRRLMEGREEWTGSPSDLLGLLTKKTPEAETKSKYWPKQPATLGKRLRRAAPFLRATGMVIDLDGTTGDHKKERCYTIRKVAGFPVRTVRTVRTQQNQGVTCGQYADSYRPQNGSTVRTGDLPSADKELEQVAVSVCNKDRKSPGQRANPGAAGSADSADSKSRPYPTCGSALRWPADLTKGTL